MNGTTLVGLFAASCTTIANLPQLKKCWSTGSAGDLSLKTFCILTTGVATWIVYGFLQNDIVIIGANAASLALILGILYYVVRERLPGMSKKPAESLVLRRAIGEPPPSIIPRKGIDGGTTISQEKRRRPSSR